MPNEKVDVFLRIAPQSWLRAGMAIACVDYWRRVPRARLRIISSDMPLTFGVANTVEILIESLNPIEIKLPLGNFHWASRLYADQQAKSPLYVLCDDDRLPMCSDWLDLGIQHWYDHNPPMGAGFKYPMMVDFSCVRAEQHYDSLSHETVSEYPFWSGPNYFSYRGAIPYAEFSGPAASQDLVIEAWAKERGIKQLIDRSLMCNHLGMGWSQAQPLLWGRY